MTLLNTNSGMALRNRRVLVASADPALVQSLREILVGEGYQVSDAPDGDHVLNFVPELVPDLILLDVELPGGSVFDTCRTLTHGFGQTGATVILIAARSDPEEVVEGLAAGGVDYLSFPFREKEVVARVRVHLLNRLRLAQLRRHDKAKNQLLLMAAHDLRNPLVSIRALTNLLRKNAVGPIVTAQREVLDTIYEASQSMLDLVNDLLDVSVLEEGGVKVTLRPTSLMDVLTTAVRLNNATAAEKRSSIVLASGALPPVLSIDEPRILQVLNNLLGNAVKFSPPGSAITVETEHATDHCSIAVQDQGPGIPEEERSRLFKDFGLTSVKATGGEPSTGLGLSICYKIMKAHAGTIQTRNLPGSGAEFRIIFPLET